VAGAAVVAVLTARVLWPRAAATVTAASHLHQALEIFQRLGMAPDTRRVRDRLDGLAA